jgi:solute carrier family 6 amino acid transporter-like protein 5/7/9/14
MQAGFYIMNLFDWYSAGVSLFIVSFFEIIAIAWVYGTCK